MTDITNEFPVVEKGATFPAGSRSAMRCKVSWVKRLFRRLGFRFYFCHNCMRWCWRVWGAARARGHLINGPNLEDPRHPESLRVVSLFCPDCVDEANAAREARK